MLKSKKQFTLSSEVVNSYGFKVLTKGIDLSQFKSNPLMLWMHSRATSGSVKEVLPLGFWEDISVSNGKITAVPVFDDKDAFAVSIYHKVENGTLRMASAGLMPINWHPNEKILEKSVLKEASIVDIGSNSEALAVALYDQNSKIISLNEAFFSRKTTVLPVLSSIEKVHPAAHKTWNELHLAGELENLLNERPDLFRLKFKEQFGKEPGPKYLQYLKA